MTMLNPKPHEDYHNKVQVHRDNKKVGLRIEVRQQELEKTYEEIILVKPEYILAKYRPRRKIIPS